MHNFVFLLLYYLSYVSSIFDGLIVTENLFKVFMAMSYNDSLLHEIFKSLTRVIVQLN